MAAVSLGPQGDLGPSIISLPIWFNPPKNPALHLEKPPALESLQLHKEAVGLSAGISAFILRPLQGH